MCGRNQEVSRLNACFGASHFGFKTRPVDTCILSLLSFRASLCRLISQNTSKYVFRCLLVQCLITITGDGYVHIVAKFISRGEESWLSFSADDGAALWEFQVNRIKLGMRRDRKEMKRAISAFWSEDLLFFSSLFCEKPSVTPRALSEGFPWFHRGSVFLGHSATFGSLLPATMSAIKNNIALVSVIGFITLKFLSQLRSLFWVCQEKTQPFHLSTWIFSFSQECHVSLKSLISWFQGLEFLPSD